MSFGNTFYITIAVVLSSCIMHTADRTSSKGTFDDSKSGGALQLKETKGRPVQQTPTIALHATLQENCRNNKHIIVWQQEIIARALWKQ